jgi:hypothetical protein
MGKVASIAVKLKKRDILLEAKRIVPKGGKAEIVVFHGKKEISRFSEEHVDTPFDEMKKSIIKVLNLELLE